MAQVNNVETEYDYLKYDYLNGFIESAATRHGNMYRGYVDRDDISQYLWEWALNHTESLERWQVDKGRNGFERVLGSVLAVEAGDYCRKSKADTLGYSLDDEFFYTKGQLETLIPLVFDKAEWLSPPAKLMDGKGGKSQRASSRGGNWVATLADVSKAMSNLKPTQRELLWKWYVAKTPISQLEEELTLSKRGVEHRINSCFKKLIRILNDAKPRNVPGADLGYVGARRVMSNAAAQALTVAEGDNAVKVDWRKRWGKRP